MASFEDKYCETCEEVKQMVETGSAEWLCLTCHMITHEE